MSADAVAILVTGHCPPEVWEALDAELTEIENRDEMARLEREMSEARPCANETMPARIELWQHKKAEVAFFNGTVVLCPPCAKAFYESERRQPVGARPGGVRP